MVITGSKARRIAELTYYAKEWDCTIEEAALSIVFDFYEAAGFAHEPLTAELNAKTAAEILQMYCEL